MYHVIIKYHTRSYMQITERGMGKAFYTGAQSLNKSESLMYAFTLKNLNKSGHGYKALTSLNIIKLMSAS